MNAFSTAPRYLRQPLEAWRNRHKIRLWRRISYALIQRLSLQERFKVRYYGAYFHPFPSSISLALWLYGEQFRSQDFLFLFELLRPGDTFIDIGANVGTHSVCIASRLGAETQVYSFEPHPRIYAYFVKNLILNRLGNVHPYNVALGDYQGSIALSDSLLDDRNYITLSCERESLSVPMNTLDSFNCALKGSTTIKLDVEGYEMNVLKGAQQTLEGTSFIYLEVGDRHSLRFGYSARQLMDFLYQMGWQMFRFEKAKNLVEVSPDYYPPDVENLVCARSPEELSKRLKTYTIQTR